MNIQSNLINLNPLPSPVKPTGRSDISGNDPTRNESENKQHTVTKESLFSDQTYDQEALFSSLQSTENSQKVTPDSYKKDASSASAINAYVSNASIPEHEAREEISAQFGFEAYS